MIEPMTADLVRELWSQTCNSAGKHDWSHIFPYDHEDIVFEDSIQRIEGIDYPRGGTGKLPEKLVQFIEDHGGAITGWTFTDTNIPVEHQLPKIATAIRTPIPSIFQADQWAFSPSGLFTSILTANLRRML